MWYNIENWTDFKIGGVSMNEKAQSNNGSISLLASLAYLANGVLIYFNNDVDKVGAKILYTQMGLIIVVWAVCTITFVCFLTKKMWKSKQKATAMMQDFFTENKVSGFNVNHQGKRDESSFIIGTLATTRGNFRVNCFLKKVENQYLIHQIRIDKINE